MARCFPDYGGVAFAFSSKAEQKVYTALKEQLPDSYSVFHSVAWIARNQNGEASDGETDFLVAHPDEGILAIEVKGGGVRVDYRTGRWSSVDALGRVHQISNPFKQAMRGKYSLLAKLREHPDWKRIGIGRIATGHAVLLPDLTDARRLQGPDAPAEILGDASDLAHIDRWVGRVFGHWRGADVQKIDSVSTLGAAGVDLVRRVFARVVEVRPLLSHVAAEEEEERLRLTADQVQVLDLLTRQRRVAVSGGAGTGKTLLAAEKARRLAAEGFATLLTCFNRPLADHLHSLCIGINGLEVASFHQVCQGWAKEAAALGRDVIAEAKVQYPRYDYYSVQLPAAFTLATDIVKRRYDAIVVDEGQDFNDEFWLPIELSLVDADRSPLYIFYDENQAVYRLANGFPLKLAPIALSKNCRNTRVIHDAAFRHYRGPDAEPPPLVGTPIIRLEEDTIDRQARAISRYISQLLAEEKFCPEDIVVLCADRIRRSEYERSLSSTALPSGAAWNTSGVKQSGRVLVETVARFKGLESLACILWLGQGQADLDGRETLYVGLSRARSLLAVCGSHATVGDAIGP
jgi:hypothetical protein